VMSRVSSAAAFMPVKLKLPVGWNTASMHKSQPQNHQHPIAQYVTCATVQGCVAIWATWHEWKTCSAKRDLCARCTTSCNSCHDAANIIWQHCCNFCRCSPG
jgi:hypothetical protein